MQREVSAAEATEWKQQLHHPRLASTQAALLHIHLGETLLTRDEQPESAHWHFRQAKKLAKHSRELCGLASYDEVIGAYYEGAYGEAQQGFKNLLTNHSGLRFRTTTTAS